MQPTQQHGLRIPPLSFESPFLIRIFLVSAFLPEVTQQIHSLRASGVISSHTARAFGAEKIAFRQSSGILCTCPRATRRRVVPPARPCLLIGLLYQIPTPDNILVFLRIREYCDLHHLPTIFVGGEGIGPSYRDSKSRVLP